MAFRLDVTRRQPDVRQLGMDQNAKTLGVGMAGLLVGIVATWALVQHPAPRPLDAPVRSDVNDAQWRWLSDKLADMERNLSDIKSDCSDCSLCD